MTHTKASSQTMIRRFYEDLRKVARNRIRSERRKCTIFPTELLHEAFLKLGPSASSVWKNPAHFFGSAARAMRQVLIDRARRKMAGKNGGDVQQVALDRASQAPGFSEPDWEAVDRAFSKLQTQDTRTAQVVELFYFCGLSVEETAKALGISGSSVKREWSYAKAWIGREITQGG